MSKKKVQKRGELWGGSISDFYQKNPRGLSFIKGETGFIRDVEGMEKRCPVRGEK